MHTIARLLMLAVGLLNLATLGVFIQRVTYYSGEQFYVLWAYGLLFLAVPTWLGMIGVMLIPAADVPRKLAIRWVMAAVVPVVVCGYILFEFDMMVANN